MKSTSGTIEQRYRLAREQFEEVGVDIDHALKTVAQTPVSVHCWQGDDVGGFEGSGEELSGGIAVTGDYPGRATNADELRSDFQKALSLIPGRRRFNLHASYLEAAGGPINRDEIEPEHFQGWVQWAREHDLGLDFNSTFFSHPRSKDGFTLSHPDPGVREFWIEHGVRCRRIGAFFGEALGTPCVTNHWVPDGAKDTPVDRKSPRDRLAESFDRIFEPEISVAHNRDAVECKLFGIGSESYVVGSHEFYLGYAITRRKLLCLDAGHFHPTETIADKVSSVMKWVDQLLLHVSRGVRWDSDHVVISNDDTLAIMQELVRGGFLDRTRIGLDFFDATINRIAAWVIGTRATMYTLLAALLEPVEQLRRCEEAGDYTRRLALQEVARRLPYGAVWDHYCLSQEVPLDTQWMEEVKLYERNVLASR